MSDRSPEHIRLRRPNRHAGITNLGSRMLCEVGVQLFDLADARLGDPALAELRDPPVREPCPLAERRPFTLAGVQLGASAFGEAWDLAGHLQPNLSAYG